MAIDECVKLWNEDEFNGGMTFDALKGQWFWYVKGVGMAEGEVTEE